MQKRFFSIAVLCLCLSSFVFLSGCGESLFKGLDGDTEASTSSEANEDGNYTLGLSLAQKVIDNPNATDTEKQNAYVQKGIALLGINNMSVLSLAEILKETDEDNIVETLSAIFEITPSAAADIADAFNEAYTLGGGDLGLSALSATQLSSTASSLDSNKQLLRGMANLSVVVKMTTRVFNIASDGSVTLTEETASYSDALDYLLSGSRTVFYYAENAIDGFTSANAFTEYQLEQADKVRVAGLNLKNLYTAKEAIGAARLFTLRYYDTDGVSQNVTGNDAYTVTLRNTSVEEEADLETALDAIFAYINN